MALKAKLTNLDGLEAGLAKLYRKQGEGEGAFFVLDVEPVEGYSLEHVTGLKTALEKEREAKAELDAALKAYEGLDAARAREALEKLDQMKNWSSDDKVREQVEQHGKAVAAEKEKVISQITSNRDLYRSAFEKLAVEQALLTAAAEAKFIAPAIAAKLFRENVKLEERDGRPVVVVVGPDGKPMRATNDDGTTREVTIKEFVATKAADKEYAPLVAGNSATGVSGPSLADSRSSKQDSGQTPLHLRRQQIDNELADEIVKVRG